MTRPHLAAFLAICAARCVVDVLRHGYGWSHALGWTWASHRALWRMVGAG